MAINIQEILNPSDSNQIKWEKVNYNFDQLLANGGGPIGIKGTKGSSGSKGYTGSTGTQGIKGSKGDNGAAASRWETITINPDGVAPNEYVILKPKVNTDTYHPTIFLGDQTFNETTSTNGVINLRSTLTIGKHAQGGNSPSSELVTLWHGLNSTTNNNVAITISSDEVTESGVTWTKFSLAETYGLNAAEVVEFNINLDKVSLNSKVYFEGTDSSFKLPATNIDAALLEEGMLRYTAGSYWGTTNSGGTIVWTEFCMAPCGQGGTAGTITIGGGDLNIDQYGDAIGNTVTVNGGSLILANDGAIWNGITTTTSTTTIAPAYTIVFNPTPTFSGANLLGATGTGSTAAYVTGPTAGLITIPSTVVSPAWVTIDGTQDAGGAGELAFTTSTNTGVERTGTITIQHPSDPNTTASFTVTQAAAAIAGCTDPSANNYNAAATVDDGSCTYPPDPTYAFSSTVTDNVANAFISNSNTGTTGLGTITSNAVTSGNTATVDVYVHPNTDYAFTNINQITILPSPGMVYSAITLVGTSLKFTASYPNITNAVANTLTVNAANNGAIFTGVSYLQLAGNFASRSEGQWITFTLTTANVPTNTTVDWTLTGIQYEDVNGALTGTFTIDNNNTATMSKYFVEDYTTEGQEVATITLASSDSAGNATGSISGSVSVVDTSENTTTTTTTLAPVTNTFNFTNPHTQTAPLYLSWNDPYTLDYTWTGNPLQAGDFYNYNWNGMTSVNITVNNALSQVTYEFVGDEINDPQGQQGPQQNGIVFNGNASGQPSTGGNTGVWTVLMPSCIVYGQPIQMADGTTKLVEDIEVGDVVKALTITGLGEEETAWETWSTSTFESTSATTVITNAQHGDFSRYTNISLSQGPALKITHEHPVLSKKDGVSAFRRVDALLVGDDIYNGVIGTWVTITNIEIIEGYVQTVSLGAETADNYFANGIVVHNIPGEEK